MSIIKYLIVVALAQFIKPYYMEISIIAAVIIVGVIIQHLLKIKEEEKERMEREDENEASFNNSKPNRWRSVRIDVP